MPLRRLLCCEAYWHSRILENATQLFEPRQAGGSVSAFPMMDMQAEGVSAFIPMHVISATGGQIFWSRSCS